CGKIARIQCFQLSLSQHMCQPGAAGNGGGQGTQATGPVQAGDDQAAETEPRHHFGGVLGIPGGANHAHRFDAVNFAQRGEGPACFRIERMKTLRFHHDQWATRQGAGAQLRQPVRHRQRHDSPRGGPGDGGGDGAFAYAGFAHQQDGARVFQIERRHIHADAKRPGEGVMRIGVAARGSQKLLGQKFGQAMAAQRRRDRIGGEIVRGAGKGEQRGAFTMLGKRAHFYTWPSVRNRTEAWISFWLITTVAGRKRSTMERTKGLICGEVRSTGTSFLPLASSKASRTCWMNCWSWEGAMASWRSSPWPMMDSAKACSQAGDSATSGRYPPGAVLAWQSWRARRARTCSVI